ncbi:M14 family metallopeptidase [soil metagenome]
MLFTNVNFHLFTFVNMKNAKQKLNNLFGKYADFRNQNLSGRYVNFDHIKDLLDALGENFLVEQIGISKLGEPVFSISFGNGNTRVLAWSQMHGNETTTTKAVFDLLNAFQKFPNDAMLQGILETQRILIIPMLNPDGARKYTRENANNIDLNRDALSLSEVESKILRKTFQSFKPDFCFNLHDQRTIFSAGRNPNPATLSFLTPAMDEERAVHPERKISMQLIAAIAADLYQFIPGQIGRYSDEFNPNCTGDTFQTLGIPTVLFEAGHYLNDYPREKTREFITISLLSALNSLATVSWQGFSAQQYFDIPENKKMFYDIILRNVQNDKNLVDVGIQFKEILEGDAINFIPYVDKIKAQLDYYGHKEINCQGEEVTSNAYQTLRENDIVHHIHLKNEVLAINYQNI